MDYIDKHSFERYVDTAFEIDPVDRNQLYHQMMDLIEENDCENASGFILEMFVKFMEDRKNEFEYKAAEKHDGNEPGGVFRRVG